MRIVVDSAAGGVSSSLSAAFAESGHEVSVAAEDFSAVRAELTGADVVVLVLTEERLRRVTALVEELRDLALDSNRETVVVLVSSTMTWADCPAPEVEIAAEPAAPAPAEVEPAAAGEEGEATAGEGEAVSAAEGEAAAPAAAAEAAPAEGDAAVPAAEGEEGAAAPEPEPTVALHLLHEAAFATRRASTRFAAWRVLESVLLRASAAPRSGLRAVVVGAGAVYGRDGGAFTEILTQAWARPHVPLRLRAELGANLPSLIHADDLARTVVKAAEATAAEALAAAAADAATIDGGVAEEKSDAGDAAATAALEACPRYIIAVDASSVAFRDVAGGLCAALGGVGFETSDAAAAPAAAETEIARLAQALEPTSAYAVEGGPLLSQVRFDRAATFASALDSAVDDDDDDAASSSSSSSASSSAWVSRAGPVVADVAAEFIASRGLCALRMCVGGVGAAALCAELAACYGVPLVSPSAAMACHAERNGGTAAADHATAMRWRLAQADCANRGYVLNLDSAHLDGVGSTAALASSTAAEGDADAAAAAAPATVDHAVALSAVLRKAEPTPDADAAEEKESAGEKAAEKEWSPESDAVVVWLCNAPLDAETGAGPVDEIVATAFGAKPINVMVLDAEAGASRAAVDAALAAGVGGAEALAAQVVQREAWGLATKPAAAAAAAAAAAEAVKAADAAAAEKAAAEAALAATFQVPGFEVPLHPDDVALLRERTKPLRAYMMTHLAPVLTEGVQAVIEAAPEDPVDALAQWLRKNDGGMPYPVEVEAQKEAEKEE